MPLIYSLVSRSIHVLAEYTASGLTGNFSTVSRVLLKVRHTGHTRDTSRLASVDMGQGDGSWWPRIRVSVTSLAPRSLRSGRTHLLDHSAISTPAIFERHHILAPNASLSADRRVSHVRAGG